MSVTLATNVRLNATTQYLDYQFNSSALWQGQVLLARADGLYIVGGDSDDNAEITAGFTLPEADFGSSLQKHIRSLDLSYQALGRISVQATFDKANAFVMIAPTSSGVEANAKLDGKRDCYGRNLGVKVSNIGGSFFTIFGLSGFLISSLRRTR